MMIREVAEQIRQRLLETKDLQTEPLISQTFECQKCKDTGYVMWQDDEGRYMQAVCECGKVQRDVQSRKMRFAAIPEKYRQTRFQDFRDDVYKRNESRQLAVKAKMIVKEYAKNFDEYQKNGKGLYLYSNTKGSGKTMMMCAIANWMAQKHTVKFATTAQILAEIKSTWDRVSDTTESELLHNISSTEILIIDDFGAERMVDWVNSVFYGIINERYNSKRVTLFTSNDAVDKTGYDERIKNRVAAMTYQIHFPEESIRAEEAKKDTENLIEKILSQG